MNHKLTNTLLVIVSILLPVTSWGIYNGLLGPAGTQLRAPRWEDNQLIFATASRLGTTDPDWAQFGASGVYQYAFDGGGTRDEELMSAGQMFHSWKEGSDICCHIHWAPGTSDTGNVRWCLEVVDANIDEVFTPRSPTCANCAAAGVALTHQVCDIVTIPMTGKTISAAAGLRIYREATNALDTYNGHDAFGVFMDCHYQRDSDGSIEEDDK